MEDFVSTGTDALRSRPRDADAGHRAEKKGHLAEIGNLAMQMKGYKIATDFVGQGKPQPDPGSAQRPTGMLPCNDNGRVLGRLRCPAVVKDCGAPWEYTPRTLQQNGLREFLVGALKQEFYQCNRFASIEHARLKSRVWIHRFNTRRPPPPAYKTPTQYHQHPCNSAALTSLKAAQLWRETTWGR